ncbi:MAG: sodium-dependent transporter [Calditrichaceae bacterium]|nr:sodium-dependent transporter [Calditrichaceae bacterium]MBN2708313.1 sodium-dependent transporter [Calditrichaceae bacterium]RQV97232.1 MAG: sodium-dependent transporter [Calditrichota bacterium]
MSVKNEFFSTRFGLIAAAIGMAIGAGNIWRFPRLAGQYGGSFLVPWFIFLFLWSIPLLITEFSIGKKTKQGVIGSFYTALGSNYIWMGFFIAFCTSAIMFYYSVVCGWSLKYFLMSFTGSVFEVSHSAFWESYTSSVFQPLAFHFFSLFIGGFIIYRGILKGVEKFSKFIVPLLFILLIIAAIKAISLDNAFTGIQYYFNLHSESFSNYRMWLDGLSQSAWSTGAGWGLILTYAIYAKKKENVIGDSFLTGIGNNLASIIAGLAIIPTVFALSETIISAKETLNVGNQGLAFIVIPQLFQKISAGQLFITVFFLALFFAAISSLVSMLEMAVRIFIDFGFNRKKAVIMITSITAALGAPSAISLNFFNNQDWVWGLGLMLSGAFFTYTVIKIGVVTFVKDWVQIKSNKTIYIKIFKILFYFILPLEFTGMFAWWIWQSIQWYPKTWWNPTEIFNLGTCILQWVIICAAGFILSRNIKRMLVINKDKG